MERPYAPVLCSGLSPELSEIFRAAAYTVRVADAGDTESQEEAGIAFPDII